MKNIPVKNFIKIIFFGLILISCSESDSDDVMNPDTNPSPGVDTSLNKKPLGEAANDLLSDSKFDKLVVDIMYVDGQQPTNTAIDNFKSFLQNRLHKTSITINQRNIGIGLRLILIHKKNLT